MSYVSPRRLERFWDDAKTWIAGKYEPKLSFNSTPVYDVTLGEDISPTREEPYVVTTEMLGGIWAGVWVSCVSASGSAAVYCDAVLTDDTKLLSVLRSGQPYSALFFLRVNGVWLTDCWSGNVETTSKNVFRPKIIPEFSSQPIKSLLLWNDTIKAGSQITIYAATEA